MTAPQPARAPLLRLSKVVKTFPNPLDPADPIRALDGLDLTLRPGDRMIALTGPDDAGKSTFLRALCGLETPDSGAVEVFGAEPDPDDEAFAGAIAFMPQTLGLYRDLSCRENLELFAGLRGYEGAERGAAGLADRIRDLLAMTGLAGFEERRAGRLSGGMKQKLALASSLLRVPRLLLLDEPTVGVDPLSRRELWSVVRRMIERSDMTCIYSTAYLEEAAFADRVLLFDRGRIIADDAPERLTALARGRTFSVALGGRPESEAQGLCRALAGATRADSADAALLDAVQRRGEAAVVAAEASSPKTLPQWAAAGYAGREPILEDAYALLTFPAAPRTHAPGAAATGVRGIPAADAETARSGERRLADAPVIIRAENICRRFGAFVAVADTTFDVRRGEIFGLLGPNGAGKTTTFRMLCGLLAPSGGTIEVAGCDLRTARAGARARIGYVAQRFSLYGKLTVEQNLRYFGRSYGLSGDGLARRIEASLADFGLAERRGTLAAALPFGARRDLSMACGLIHSPRILFLDEATSGADLASRRAFWRRINALAAGGTTVVVTTHFLEEAEYCDRFLIQDAGRVLALGTPREVKADAQRMSPELAGADPSSLSIEDAFVAIVEAGRRAAVPASGERK